MRTAECTLASRIKDIDRIYADCQLDGYTCLLGSRQALFSEAGVHGGIAKKKSMTIPTKTKEGGAAAAYSHIIDTPSLLCQT